MASTLVSFGLSSRDGRSSANARPNVTSTSGFLPLLISDSRVSVATPSVRSHFSGPGIGRSGGSMSDGPVHTCTPWMNPSDITTGSVRMTRSRLGVMLVNAWPVCTDSAIAVRTAER